MIHIEHFTFNDFQTRCSVVWDETLECAIVDPGCSSAAETARITDFISRHGLKPVCIMLTHGHFDHVLGVAGLAVHYARPTDGPDSPATPLPVYMHPADKFTLENNEYFCKWFGAPMPAAFETVDIREEAEGCVPENAVTEGYMAGISTVKIGNLRFKVIETPGHTVGGVCYYEPSEKVLFSGDTLFSGAIGRTDHPGGDYDMIMKSILEKIVTLDGSVTVIPGHGPCTDIATEGMTNPFLLPFNEPFEE